MTSATQAANYVYAVKFPVIQRINVPVAMSTGYKETREQGL